MSNSSFSDYANDFDTDRSLNGAASRPKAAVPARNSLREREEEFTLEGWCRNGKISKTIIEDHNNNNLSGFSDDSWTAEENNANAFKNALAVLSEGLTSMHRKGLANRVTPEVQKQTANNNNNKIKNRRVPSLKKKTLQPPKYRSSVGCQEREKTSLADIGHEEDSSISMNKNKDGNTSRASIHLPSLDLKPSSHHNISQEHISDTHDILSHSMLKALEVPGARTYCEVDREKMVSMDQLPKTWNHLDQEVQPNKKQEVFVYELKPAKLNPIQNVPVSSHKDIESIFAPKPNPLVQRNYNPPPKELKPSNTFRLGAFSNNDELKTNKSLLPTKKILSPANNFIFPETVKASKSDIASNNVPVLLTQKAPLLNKEGPNPSQLRFESLRSNVNRSMKENASSETRTLALSKKQIENANGNTEAEGIRASLRNVLGQVFNENQQENQNHSRPKESLQMLPEIKVTAPAPVDENSQRPIDYLLGLYKINAEKSIDRPKPVDRFSTGGYKVADFLKKLGDVPVKPKQFNQSESLNNSLFGKDKGTKPKDLGQRFSVNSNQNRNEVVFRLRKMKANYAEHRLSIL